VKINFLYLKRFFYLLILNIVLLLGLILSSALRA
jgi:chromosome segregation ATPase